MASISLELVDKTEVEVVAAQLKAKSVLAVGAVAVVRLAVAEETGVCNKVEILSQTYANTGRYTNAPANEGIVVIFITLYRRFCFGSADAETKVEEEFNGAKLGIAPTCVRINRETVDFYLVEGFAIPFA